MAANCARVMGAPGADTAGGSPWYKPGMDWAVTRGISDGSAPGAPITREQLAAMLWRYAGNPVSQGSLDGFTDAGQVGAYAAEALRWAVGAGLITGTDAGALNYLRGRVFTVADVPFRDKYFPAPETPKKIPVKPRRNL